MTNKEKLYYTSIGKMLRGFLCLLALAIVVAGSTYLFNMYSEYGMYMFATENVPYIKTDCYEDDLIKAVEAAQSNAMDLVGASTKVVIYDTVYKSYVARTSESEGEDFRHFSFDGETNVEVNQVYQKDMPFDDFSWVTDELKKKQTGAVFVHFSKDGFKELFIKCGKKNKKFRYSEDFSEDCYFVFPNKEMAETGEAYAVYDPEKDIYYTTFDEFFPAYNSYFYRLEEVSGIMDMGDYEYDNVVFPLLRSYNYTSSYIVDLFQRTDNKANGSVEEFEKIKNDAFVYYYSSNQLLGDWNKNVKKKENITELEKFYYLRADGEQDIGQTSLSDELGASAQSIINSTSWWPLDMEFYFGMDYDRTEEILKKNGNKNKSNLYYYFRYINYNNGKKFFFPVLILDILAMAGFLYLALNLMRTTGKRMVKKDGTVKKQNLYLNVFDKMSTELYLAISCAVLLFAGFIAVTIFIEFYKRIRQYMAFAIIGSGATVFIYGILVMLILLSFVRRIKARNIINHIECVRLGKWAVKRLVALYRKHAGTKLFSVLFQWYMGIQVVIILLAFVVAYQQKAVYPYVIILFLLIIPNLFAFYAMRKLFEDVTLITQCMDKIKDGDLEAKCDMTEGGHFLTEVAEGVDGMGDGIKRAVDQSIRDERMRTELITNVSHDLKTPLTSIINYVDLLKKEDMHTDAAKHYLEILEQKSQRLKHLTEDLVEAAKANTGNIELECIPLAFDELMRQAIGEFEDKFASRELTIVTSFPKEPVIIMADGRRMFRIVENVLQNVFKYAMESTRVYADIFVKEKSVVFELKNISRAPLNISPDELMERFTRGDSSRSTEGSGLGLSIAKDLTTLMEGQFNIKLDGDLFKAVIEFPLYVEPSQEELAAAEAQEEADSEVEDNADSEVEVNNEEAADDVEEETKIELYIDSDD